MPNDYILTSDGNFISEDELYHWGIKAMKWGVRRHQNYDGSYTKAGMNDIVMRWLFMINAGRIIRKLRTVD